MDIQKRIKEIDDRITELRILVKEKEKEWDRILEEKYPSDDINEYARTLETRNLFNEFGEFQEFLNPEQAEIEALSDEKRMIKPYKLSPIPDYGDVMTLKEFIDHCKCGNFVDYIHH